MWDREGRGREGEGRERKMGFMSVILLVEGETIPARRCAAALIRLGDREDVNSKPQNCMLHL